MDDPPRRRPIQDLGEALGYRGSTVVVVGCSTGIGQATARLLGDLGARVHAVGVHELPVAVEGFHATDLASPERVVATAAALASVGPIHSLFCCSGVPATCPPLDIVRVNYVGLRQLVDLTLPSIADGGGVAIISSNVAAGWPGRLPELVDIIGLSDAGAAMRWFEDHPDVVADGYRLAKHLLCAWVAGIAPALGFERGVRINCTAPGPTATPLVDRTTALVGATFFDEFPYPVLGRISTPEEQAWPLVLLNSRLNAVVTGTTLFTDQGVADGVAVGAIDAGAIVPARRQRAPAEAGRTAGDVVEANYGCTTV